MVNRMMNKKVKPKILGAFLTLILVSIFAGIAIGSVITVPDPAVPNLTPSASQPYILEDPSTIYDLQVRQLTNGTFYLKNGTNGDTFGYTTDADAVLNAAFHADVHSIYVDSGTYVLGEEITDAGQNNVTVNFSPGAELRVGVGANSTAIWLSSVSNWVISGAHIDGDWANQEDASGVQGEGKELFGIVLQDTKYTTVENSFITRVGQYGIFFAASGVNGSVGNTVKNNVISYSGWNGIAMGGGSQETWLVENTISENTVLWSGDVGISSYGSRNKIHHNVVDGYWTQGIGWNDAGYGLANEGGYDNEWNDNTVSGMLVGIIAAAGANSFKNNEVIHNKVGISLNSAGNMVFGNTVKDWDIAQTGVRGIQVVDVDSNVITENYLSSSSAVANAIFIGGSLDTKVTDNTITITSGTNSYGIEVMVANRTLITGNKVTGYNGISIADTAWDTIVQRNDVSQCSSVKINDEGTATNRGLTVDVITLTTSTGSTTSATYVDDYSRTLFNAANYQNILTIKLRVVPQLQSVGTDVTYGIKIYDATAASAIAASEITGTISTQWNTDVKISADFSTTSGTTLRVFYFNIKSNGTATMIFLTPQIEVTCDSNILG